jgi:hypothetical protein
MVNRGLNSNNNKRLLINQIALFGILFGIILIISLLLPFPVSLIAILGVFVLRNMYRRRSVIKRMNHISEAWGTFRSTPSNFSGSSNRNNSSSLKYHCISCGEEHEEAACPKCASKIKKVVFDG